MEQIEIERNEMKVILKYPENNNMNAEETQNVLNEIRSLLDMELYRQLDIKR